MYTAHVYFLRFQTFFCIDNTCAIGRKIRYMLLLLFHVLVITCVILSLCGKIACHLLNFTVSVITDIYNMLLQESKLHFTNILNIRVLDFHIGNVDILV
jgi:hypothetical protein